MISALVISNIISWVVVIAMAVVVFALARQIGVLHERIKPVGALSLGEAIKAGDIAPQFDLDSISGDTVSVGGIKEQSTLLFFLSSTCPVCKTLLPVLKDIQKQEQATLRLIFASDGPVSEHFSFVTEHELGAFPYVLSLELGMAYQISKLPYGVLINPQGKVAAHGLINNREHLESLLEAEALGVGTIQEYKTKATAK